MSNAIKKAPLASASAGPQSLDELRRSEAATKTRLDTAEAELALREARYANPEPSDTAETLAQIEKAIADGKRAVHLAKANHDRAVAAREAAEHDHARAEICREGADLKRELEEQIKTFPGAYARLAEQLLSLVTCLHLLDQKILAHNKKVAAYKDAWSGDATAEFVDTFEQRVRWTRSDARSRGGIYPKPLADIFEIPALKRGDKDFRVPGTQRPGGIWIDVNGHARS